MDEFAGHRFRSRLKPLPEAELLLRETSAFVTSEIAGALASLRIMAATDSGLGGRAELKRVIQQLESTGECLSIIVQHPRGRVRVDRSIERLCRAMGQWRTYTDNKEVRLNLPAVRLGSKLARRLNIIAAELISAGFRYGLEAGGTSLRVILREGEGEVLLSVIDNGPGCSLDRPIGTAAGLRLASELARRAGGRLYITADASGSAVLVTLPTGPKEAPR